MFISKTISRQIRLSSKSSYCFRLFGTKFADRFPQQIEKYFYFWYNHMIVHLYSAETCQLVQQICFLQIFYCIPAKLRLNSKIHIMFLFACNFFIPFTDSKKKKEHTTFLKQLIYASEVLQKCNRVQKILKKCACVR